MSRYVIREGPREHDHIFTDKMNLLLTPGFRTIEAYDTLEGKPVAAAGFDNWTPNACEVHMWVDNPLVFFKRATMGTVFDYVFRHAGKSVVYTLTPGDKQRSLDLQRGFGFREAYRLKDGWAPGVDLVMNELRKEHCRYLSRPVRKVA